MVTLNKNKNKIWHVIVFILISSVIQVPFIKTQIPSLNKTLEQQLLDILSSKLPPFSNDNNNLIALYEKFLPLFSVTTEQGTLEKGLENFSDSIITPSLTQTSATLKNLDDISALCSQIISTLATLNNKLASVPNTDQKRTMISRYLNMLKTKVSDFSKKIQKQKALKNILDNAQRQSDSELRKKVDRFLSVLQQIDQDTLDDLKTEFIKGLENLVTYAKGKSDTEITIVKPLISKAQETTFFTTEQKLQLAGMLEGTQKIDIKPVTVVQAVEVPKVDVNATFHNKLKEVTTKQTIAEKKLGFQELLTFLTTATLQADKNSIVTLCNDLFLQQGTMKKSELMDLREIFATGLKNQFLLATNQRPVMEQWIKTVDLAMDLADDNDTLITSVKNKMNLEKQNFSLALKAMFYAINLLETKLSPEELDKRKDTSLLSLIKKKIQAYYNERAYKKIDDLKDLKNILDLVTRRRDTADAVSKDWLDNLNLNMQLLQAQQQTQVLPQLQALASLGKIIKPATDRYEKGLFIDMMTTHFINRKERAVREIEMLQSIFTTLTSPAVVNSRTFDNTTMSRFTEWNKILQSTYALLIAQYKQAAQKITQLKTLLLTISLKSADYERSLFTPLLREIFDVRGDMNPLTLTEAKNFFTAVQKTPGLITNGSLPLADWIKELDDALKLSKDESLSYLDSLIKLAKRTKNAAVCMQALKLFTAQTTAETKNNFITVVRTMLADKSINRTSALNTLRNAMVQKKIGSNALFSREQLALLQQVQPSP